MKNLKLGAHALMLTECAFIPCCSPPCSTGSLGALQEGRLSCGVLPKQRQQIQVGLEAMFSSIFFPFDKC